MSSSRRNRTTVAGRRLCVLVPPMKIPAPMPFVGAPLRGRPATLGGHTGPPLLFRTIFTGSGEPRDHGNLVVNAVTLVHHQDTKTPRRPLEIGCGSRFRAKMRAMLSCD